MTGSQNHYLLSPLSEARIPWGASYQAHALLVGFSKAYGGPMWGTGDCTGWAFALIQQGYSDVLMLAMPVGIFIFDQAGGEQFHGDHSS